MTVCQSPPGRASSVQAGTVQPFGPHHLTICAGAVKARNTRSRGAAKLRDRRSTWVSFVFGWAIVIGVVLLFGTAQVLRQPVQALRPEPLVLLEPAGCRAQAVRPQR